MTGILIIVLVILSILIAWEVHRHKAPTKPDDPTPIEGKSFPRCQTCASWPGTAMPCPKTTHVEEATDGCKNHVDRKAP